jgi:transcriptional regulator with XRE-family HTH domain
MAFDRGTPARKDATRVRTEPGPTETIGQRLRRLRTDKRLSQRELSSPGVSYAYISRIEAGTRTPSVKALRMLARKLGVSADYLETGVEVGQRAQREMRLADAELQLRLAPEAVDAERELREVLADAAEAGDERHAHRARIALGLAAAAGGNHDDAIGLLEPDVDAGATPAAARPDVYATLAQSYVASGTPDRAVELLRRCLDDVRERAPDDTAVQLRYASHLSAALAAAGDAEAAREALDAVLEAPDAAADPHTRARGYWELARTHERNGHPAFALDAYRRAVALFEATDDTIDVARAHVAAASALVDAKRPAEAERHLDTAERLLVAAPATGDVGRLRTEQARLAQAAGRPAAEALSSR